MKYFRLTILASFLLSCNDGSTVCDNDGVGPNGELYKVRGCMVNSLEDGTWKIYDSAQKLSATGKFEKGIRVGTWQYGEAANNETIEWKKYENVRLKIKTNIPQGLELVEDSSGFIKFSNKDSNNLFNLVFIDHNLNEESIYVPEYHKVGESEVLAKGWKYLQKKIRLDLKNDTLYFNSYQIQDGKNGFSILNIYEKLDNHLIEVICRYNEPSEREAKRVFFSVISNLFLQKNRFMNPFDKVNIVTL